MDFKWLLRNHIGEQYLAIGKIQLAAEGVAKILDRYLDVVLIKVYLQDAHYFYAKSGLLAPMLSSDPLLKFTAPQGFWTS